MSERPGPWAQQIPLGHVGMAWPSMPQGEALKLAHLVAQLNQTQWLSPEAIRAAQFAQLQQVVAFCDQLLPVYGPRLRAAGHVQGQAMDEATWRRVPVLTRAEFQTRNTEFFCRTPPQDHLPTHQNQSSGSTGQPVKIQGTAITRMLWNAITVRLYQWHVDGPGGKVGVIRALGSQGVGADQQVSNWGAPISLLYTTGPASSTDCRRDPEQLLQWLERESPDTLVVFPSTLEAMAQRARSSGRAPHRPRAILTLSESLRPDVRALAHEIFGAHVADMYSAQEIGYLALQCPSGPHYHVQAEHLLVEVLDEHDQPCAPGQTGRVVVTTLNNFASPLLRYAIGDYATVGAPCACGRGLPVLQRIDGRQRNLITLPDGTRYWPVMDAKAWTHIAPIHQLQLVQKTPERFLARIYAERALTDDECAQLVAAFQKSLNYPFAFTFEWLRERLVTVNGKFDSIMSEVPAPGR